MFPHKLCTSCFQSLLGLTVIPKQKHWGGGRGANKDYYGIFRSRLFQPNVPNLSTHEVESTMYEHASVKTILFFELLERITEVKQEMIKFAQDHPGDKEQIRVEAIKRLEDIVEKLPLKKSVIESQEHKIKKSPMLQQIVVSMDKRELKERIRRALADYIAEDVP